MNSTPPAGWFPDPQDESQFRYWDGDRWTDHRAPKTPTAPPPPGLGGSGGSVALLATPAPPAPAPTKKKSWFLRHKILTGLLTIVAIIVIAVVTNNGGGGNGGSNSSSSGNHQRASTSKQGSDQSSKASKPAPSYTVAQENAIQSAKSYLSMGSGFSRAGLIQQLTSKAGEGFKKANAVFAVNHIKVDWNKQAVLSAKSYLDMGSGFSRAGLIQQLTSKAGEQYTLAQATYAANHVGL